MALPDIERTINTVSVWVNEMALYFFDFYRVYARKQLVIIDFVVVLARLAGPSG